MHFLFWLHAFNQQTGSTGKETIHRMVQGALDETSPFCCIFWWSAIVYHHLSWLCDNVFGA